MPQIILDNTKLCFVDVQIAPAEGSEMADLSKIDAVAIACKGSALRAFTLLFRLASDT